jgi:hypothetical protein
VPVVGGVATYKGFEQCTSLLSEIWQDGGGIYYPFETYHTDKDVTKKN